MDAEYSPNLENQSEYKRIHQLYANSLKVVPATILNSSLLLVLLWTKVPWEIILVWFVVILSASLYRLHKVKQVLRTSSYLDKPHKLGLRQFIIGSSTTAAIWGASFLLFSIYTDEAYSLLMIWIASATAMGGSMSLSPSKYAQKIFVCLIFIPAIIMNVLSGNEFNVTMGLLCILFLAVLIILGNNFSNLANDSLHLENKNQELLYSLQQKNAHLEQSNQELTKTKEFLTEQTLSDPLTGIANRRSFDNTLIREWNRCLRRQYPISCILIDVDHFKKYNDNYGHQQGDLLLQKISYIISTQATRAEDLVARYGGEEFVVVLSNASHDDAVMLAERTRKAVEELDLGHDSSEHITISAGVATMTPDNTQDCYDVVHKADEKLYEAKNSGRNRTC